MRPRRRFDIREDLHLLGETRSSNLNSRNSRVQLREFGGRESNCSRADVLEHVRHLGRPGDRNDPRLLRHQPGQRDLSGGRLLSRGPLLHQVDERQVARQILRRESRLNPANVTVSEPRICIDGTERTRKDANPLVSGVGAFRLL